MGEAAHGRRLMRSTLRILIDSLRTQAAVTETYFNGKRAGLDEFTLARLQRQAEDAAATSRTIADSAEALERHALAAVEAQLSALRSLPSDHPQPPFSAA